MILTGKSETLLNTITFVQARRNQQKTQTRQTIWIRFESTL